MAPNLEQHEILFARAALRRGVIDTEAMMKAVGAVQEERRRGGRLELEQAVRHVGVPSSEIKAIRKALSKPRAKPSVKGYAVLEEIGRGALGAVYKARQASLGRIVALKVLPKALVGNSRDVDRFVREARTAAALNHGGIVRVFEVGETRDRYFIAMEYLPGETLSGRVARSGVLPPGKALACAKTMASALAHAHSRGVIHRDLKPSNVMLVADGSIRIVDLGLARGIAAVPSDRITDIGVLIGTPEFMSPEQARDPAGVDGRADLYSLGATLFFALTGKAPVQGKSTLDVLAKVFRGETTPFKSLRPELPEGFSAFIEKSLSFDPSDRFQDAGEALAALEELMASLPESERSWHEKVDDTKVTDGKPGTGEETARRRLPPALPGIVAVAGAVVGLALVLVFAQRSGESPPPPPLEVSGSPGDQVRPIAVQLEARAMELLGEAELWIEENPDDAAGARDRLSSIIEKYPGTLAAFRARDMLLKVEK